MDVDKLRQAKPGDDVGTKRLSFIVTEVVDGHVWGNVATSLVPGECCRICGWMRRRDKQNKPCPGPYRLELR